MLSGRKLFALSILLLLVLLQAACSQGDPEAEKAAVDAAEWAALEQAKKARDDKRQELVDFQALMAASEADEGTDADASEGDASEGDEGEGADAEGEAPMTAEDMAAKLDTLNDAVEDLSADFSTKLVAFINNQSITEGQEFTEIQRKAFNFKAEEDIMIAMEFIDKGGEYQRAIDILSGSLNFDPSNEMLLEAKAKAEELRYMTEERFAQVKKGMSQEEVRALLGTPKSNNQREFENDVTGWFYPKEDPPKSAAGVFFQSKNDELLVYKTDFDAVKGPAQEG